MSGEMPWLISAFIAAIVGLFGFVVLLVKYQLGQATDERARADKREERGVTSVTAALEAVRILSVTMIDELRALRADVARSEVQRRRRERET